MFSYHLDLDEKQALLRLAGYLATSDQNVSAQERKFVLEMAHDLNVSAEGVFDDLDTKALPGICAAFSRDSARRVALVELIDLALSDQAYFAEEKSAVRQVAELMDIPNEDVSAIEDWVRRGKKWHTEGHLLLGLSGGQDIDV